MALRACISIDCIPLQCLLKDNPGWAGTPVAVTREERPQSQILALNAEARDRGLSVGMKYASALSLVPSLKARAVSADRVDKARDHIARLLSSFTPDIEPCSFDRDAFWVSVEGLFSLFGTESHWIEEVRRALGAECFSASITAGFTRFGTYAIARCRRGSVVFASRKEEISAMSESSIDILPLPPKAKSVLRRLEVRTVRQFVSLPPAETERRFGRDAGLLRRAILSDDPLPIQSLCLKERTPCRRRLDAPLTDLNLLLPHIDELLGIEAGRAETEGKVITQLALLLRTEDGELSTDVIRPAVPTRRTPLLMRLIQLRLSARELSSGVEDIEIRSAWARPSKGQEELFVVRGRDMEAGARAFAAIRARFGNDAVVHAESVDSHLPERSFRWVRMDRPVLPVPRQETAPGSLAAVRRIRFEPAPVPRPVPGARKTVGPFAVSGSWWSANGKDAFYHRHYYFLDSPAGALWLFTDKLTGSSWVQGAID